jgi:hypothetical protein
VQICNRLWLLDAQRGEGDDQASTDETAEAQQQIRYNPSGGSKVSTQKPRTTNKQEQCTGRATYDGVDA